MKHELPIILCVLVRYASGEAVYEPWAEVRAGLPPGAWIDWATPKTVTVYDKPANRD